MYVIATDIGFVAADAIQPRGVQSGKPCQIALQAHLISSSEDPPHQTRLLGHAPNLLGWNRSMV